jgi:ABC-type multidrug transport system fused ATPase/permease subunit
MNDMLLSMMWNLSSVFVSFGSFFVYILLGHKLDVATAFTAIALFDMICKPLVFVPMFIVQMLQAGVSVNRIAAFLDEEEVSEQVSVLKRTTAVNAAISAQTRRADADGRLGFVHASFQWNASVEDKSKKDVTVTKSWLPWRRSRMSRDGASEAPAVPISHEDHRFELRDIDLIFPEGVLTVVTGPTASGKTALLVNTSHFYIVGVPFY